MPSYSVVLNSSNNIPYQNNSFKYNFINGGLDIPEGSEINLSQITIPYSWYNVSSQLGNNTIVYNIPNSSNAQVAYTITLPNGFFTLQDLNNSFQAGMKANGHYWYSNIGSYATQFQFVGTISTTTLTVSSGSSSAVSLIIGTSINGYGVSAGTVITAQTGPYTYTINISQTVVASTPMYGSQSNEITPAIIYPLTLSVYTPQYTNSITSITIPTSALVQNYFGSGFQYANGANGQNTWAGGYPTSGNQCAYIQIPTTNISTTTIGNLLGFSAGSYPSTITGITALQQVVNGNSLSASPPFPILATQVNGIVIRCNLVENNICMPSDVLDSMPILSTFGSNLSYLPIGNNSVKIKKGRHANMIITFNDQNFNNLPMNDPNVLISVIIRVPDKV
jgi:hypothetical protein